MTLFVIFLWLFHPVSVIFSLVLRASKKIPVLHAGGPGKNWNLIRKWGLVSATIMLVYVVVVVLILGWTLRWYTGLLVMQVICFLILDRYLIAVNYSRRFWSGSQTTVRSNIAITRISSYIYITMRCAYLLFCLVLIPVLFMVPSGFTLDTVVYGLYGELKGDRKLLKEHTPFGFEINPAMGAAFRYSKATYFDSRLILYYWESSPDELYVFTSRAAIFMKYINYDFDGPVNVNPKKLQYDEVSQTLYLDGYSGRGTADKDKERTKIVWENGSFYLDRYTRQLSPGQDGYRDSAQITDLRQKIKF